MDDLLQSRRILPVLLGTDLTIYATARSLYERYNATSQVIGKARMFFTSHSRFIDVLTVPNFDTLEVMTTTLKNLYEETKDKYDHYILFGANDGYADLSARVLPALPHCFKAPTPSIALLDTLLEKREFYQLCDTFDLPYPATEVTTYHDWESFHTAFEFPVVIKPSHTVSYFPLAFEGKKKVYYAYSHDDVRNICQLIYSSGYMRDLIIQEYVAGPDTNDRVFNCYITQNGDMTASCWGKPIAEDHTPELRGNYVAVTHVYDKDLEKLTPKIQHFLKGINYTGLANMDFRYDTKDNTYKIFELNYRQGRSSSYCLPAGVNLPAAAVEDLALGNKDYFETGTEEFLWTLVDPHKLIDYIDDPADNQIVNEMIHRDKVFIPYLNKAERSLRRIYQTKDYFKRATQKYCYYATKDQHDL